MVQHPLPLGRERLAAKILDGWAQILEFGPESGSQIEGPRGPGPLGAIPTPCRAGLGFRTEPLGVVWFTEGSVSSQPAAQSESGESLPAQSESL